MSRYQFIVHGPRSKAEAISVVRAAPPGTRIEIKAAKRTSDQNALMWVLLTKLSLALPWGGARQTPDRWKRCFLDALREEMEDDPELLPALFNPARKVNVSDSSSDLSKEEMSMLIELIYRFAAEHEVDLSDANAARAA